MSNCHQLSIIKYQKKYFILYSTRYVENESSIYSPPFIESYSSCKANLWQCVVIEW